MQPSAEQAYLFRHALLRETAYSLQLPSERAALHRLTVQIIEAVFGTERAGQLFADEIAGHLRTARHEDDSTIEVEAERRYTRLAAQAAEARYRREEAGQLWLSLSEITSGHAHCEAIVNAAFARRILGRPQQAIELLQPLQNLPDNEVSARNRAWVAREIGTNLESQGKRVEALRMSGVALRYALQGDDPGMIASCRVIHGYNQERAGNIKEAEENMRSALELFRSLGDRVAEARTLSNLAVVLEHSGNTPEAEEMLERAIRIHRDAGSRRGESYALSTLSVMYSQTGRLDEAQKLTEQALSICREIGDVEGIPAKHVVLAVYCRMRRQFDEAERLYTEALKGYRDVGDVSGESICFMNRGNLFAEQERHAEARVSYEAALAIDRKREFLMGVGLALSNLSRLDYAEGRFDLAESRAREAVEVFEKIGRKSSQANAMVRLADAYHAKGRSAEAEELYGRAMVIMGAINAVPALGATKCGYATMLVALGRTDEAFKEFEDGLALLRASGDVSAVKHAIDEMRKCCASAGIAPPPGGVA
jgi:tetratricopeptide (TPR) repeat protein